jgi:uncharacterized protein YkwD
VTVKFLLLNLTLLALTQCSTEADHRENRGDTQGADQDWQHSPQYGPNQPQPQPQYTPPPGQYYPPTPQQPLTPPPLAPVPEQGCYKAPSTFICELENRVAEETNRVRQMRGLSAQVHSNKLSFVARDWSAQMAQSRILSHMGFPHMREKLYADEFQIRYRMGAENVAMRTFSQNTSVESLAKAIVDSWVRSRGHLRNIVGSYRVLGVGVSTKGSSLYATQLFSNDSP